MRRGWMDGSNKQKQIEGERERERERGLIKEKYAITAATALSCGYDNERIMNIG